jgi:hypothetical protein
MKFNLKIFSALLSLGLLVTLIYKLIFVPGGMFLSGLFLGGMWIVIILIGGLLLTSLTKLIIKKLSFWTAYFILTFIAFSYFHYQIYSPTLKIIVPENFVGEVNLIKSNVSENILTLDSHGIGYLNEWTFNKLYSEPIVVDTEGNNLNNQCVGFNPTTFFGSGYSSNSENEIKIKMKSFEIVPSDKIGERQNYNTDLFQFIDFEKINRR